MGVDDMKSSNRVLMGHSDSVAYCQFCAQTIYGEMYGKGLEAWLDDVIGSATCEEELLSLHRFLLQQCVKYGLKLNPSKCDFFTQEAIWCGKHISSEGIAHDPKRINGLIELEPPENGQQLQQFLCALNWMRQSLPQFNKLVAPLQQLLETICSTAGSRKKTRLVRYMLKEFGWLPLHDQAFLDCKEALRSILTLAHPDPSKTVCLFTDASDDFWGAVVTQIPLMMRTSLSRTNGMSLWLFLVGRASLRWSTIEKEGYAIVTACKRLDYLLQRPNGFIIFTDHRNLRFVFSPDPAPHTPRYVADKLARWAVALSVFRYKSSISLARTTPTDAVVWSDKSELNDKPFIPPLRRLVTLPLPTQSPLSKNFDWPTLETTRSEQLLHPDDYTKVQANVAVDQADNVARIDVIAHAGAMGHLGIVATKHLLLEKFKWRGIGEDVELFVRNCLQCEVRHATTPNTFLHCDFLAMPGGYIHVIVDDASRMCQLTYHPTCKASDAASAMQQWFALFGIVHTWVSDQGPHYKNELIDELQRLYSNGHHFSQAHWPWINGTVEVMMRSINKSFKTLLLELKLPQQQWPSLFPVVQHALNHTPCEKLGGLAPITAMTQLPPSKALTAVISNNDIHEIDEFQLIKLRET
ncbi:hypothetical protein LEN26_015004 [Aphanomyces euteiches]|nr:hypothetical protein AeMF1_020753 [Aphanomyces euteiches]KAH9104572.1 hypothetical protein LEN26_015004 [Aphanomyces euteiches]